MSDMPTKEQFKRAAQLSNSRELRVLVELMADPANACFMLPEELRLPDPYREGEAAANRYGEYELADAMGRYADLRAEACRFRAREERAVAEGRVVSYSELYRSGEPKLSDGNMRDGKRYFAMTSNAGFFWEPEQK